MNTSHNSMLAGASRFCRIYMNYSRWVTVAISGCQLAVGILGCLVFRGFSTGILLQIVITPAMPLSMLIFTAAHLMDFNMTFDTALLVGSLTFIFLEIYVWFNNKRH